MIKSEIEYVMENGIEYKIETIYEEKENGEKVIRGRAKTPNDNSEPVEPEPTQLDRIEETVNNIATNSTSWDAMAQAISEGVNEV